MPANPRLRGRPCATRYLLLATRYSLLAAVLALLLTALLVTAIRLSPPLSAHDRDRLAAILSQRLGYPVQMGSLSLGLSGLTPRLTLDEVSLKDPESGAELLGLRALELDLNPIASVRLGSPQWSALTLVGARLAVRRLRDGQIRVVGLGALAKRDPRTLERFLTQGRLNLIASEILLVDDRLDGAALRLTDVGLRLTNAGTEHRLALSARAEPGTAAGLAGAPADARLGLQARLRGDPADLAHWGGRLYLSLDGAALAALAPKILLEPGRVGSDSVRWESWVRLEDGRLAQWLSRIGVRGLVLRPSAAPRAANAVAAGTDPATGPPVDPNPTLDRLNVLVRILPADGGWQVDVADLAVTTAAGGLTGIGLDLGLSGTGRIERLDLAAPRLDLAAAAGVARWLRGATPGPLPPGLRQLLDVEPNGTLEGLAVQVALPAGARPRWRAQGRGQGLGLAHRGRIPGVSGLRATLRANQDGGELHLGSEGLGLTLDPLFDRPLALDQLSGLLVWARSPDGGWRLSGRNLAVQNPDLRGRGRFTLDLPPSGADPGTGSGAGAVADPGPFLDLRASFTDVDGGHARPYLPVGRMHKNLIDWLTRSLVACQVPQADLILRGPLRRYPFRGQEGRFELVLELKDGVLDFLPGWPRLEGINGSLRFLDQGMDIQASSARILQTRIAAASATIPDLWAPHRMAIHGTGDGPLSDGLRILAETPLSRHLGPLARALEVQGRSHLDLDIELPLKPTEALGVDGRLTWPGPAGIALKGTPVAVTALQGELGFTVDSLHAPAIRGQLWGRPVELSIATRDPGDPRSATTQIRARSRLPVKELAARLPTPAWRLAAGELDLELGVNLHNADLREASLPLAIALRSDLRGLALDLPAPLGKTADGVARLELDADLVPGRRLDLRGRVGGLALDLDLGLGAQGPRLDRGRVHLGEESASPPDAPGLTVDGRLDRLSLPAWSRWWDRVQRDLRGLAAPAAGAGLSGLHSVDLRIGELDLGGPRLTQAHLQLAPGSGAQDGGWVLDADSQELAGRLTLPPPGRGLPLDLGLVRVDLKSLMSADTGPPADTAPSADPGTRLSALDLRVEDLLWGEGRLGRLTLGLAPDDLGTRVSGIDFRGAGDTSITGDAAWIDGEDGGRGRLALTLRSADPGPLLRVLDSANAVSQAPLESSLKLEWPGGLADFALANASGTIALKLGAGRLPKLEPGVGRVLGFLNLGALTRRLTLDFRDLYEQGFSFERIEGRIRLGDGRATVQTFVIDGPASRIQVSGYSDLRTRTFAQTVTVQPSIGTSVAIAGAVAGGPAVGAAVVVLNRISGGAIDRLGSFQYRVTGPWTDPVLQPVGWEPFAQGQGTPPPAGGQGFRSREDRGGGAGREPKAPGVPRGGRGGNLFLE